MKGRHGFTLIELLVSVAVVALLATMIFHLVSAASKTWSDSRQRVSTFQDSRVAFSQLESALSKATLNSRLDYMDLNGRPRTPGDVHFTPTQLLRDSRLHFVCGPASELLPAGDLVLTPGHAVFFQAPLGFAADTALRAGAELLNATGFFVEFGDDETPLPDFVRDLPGYTGHRFRLKQWIQPTEQLSVYESTSVVPQADPYAWFQDALPESPGGSYPAGSLVSRTLGEDIFGLICLPSLSSSDEAVLGGAVSPDYRYDSRAWASSSGIPITGVLGGRTRSERMRNQLVPFVKVAAFALERSDADRLQRQHGQSPPPELAMPTDLFGDASRFDSDIVEWERRLLAQSPPIRPRIFRTTIPLNSAQWSNE